MVELGACSFCGREHLPPHIQDSLNPPPLLNQLSDKKITVESPVLPWDVCRDSGKIWLNMVRLMKMADLLHYAVRNLIFTPRQIITLWLGYFCPCCLFVAFCLAWYIQETSDHLLYPNPGSGMIHEQHLQFFHFLGILLAKVSNFCTVLVDTVLHHGITCFSPYRPCLRGFLLIYRLRRSFWAN